MKKWRSHVATAAIAVVGLALALRLHSLSKPLPDPKPYAGPLPSATPPRELAVYAVVTGVGSLLFERRDFCMAGVLVKHPKGDLLIDTGFGRHIDEQFRTLEVLAEFSQRQIDYFHGLPAALRGTETIRNASFALVNHSRAVRTLGQLDLAGANADEAVKLLNGLRESGDHSEPTTIALALAYAAKARVLESRADPSDMPTNQRAIAVLQPLLSAPGASPAVRRAYVTIAHRIGVEEWAERPEDAIRTEREVMRVAADLGARDLHDLDMGAYYAEAGGWMVTALEFLGRYEEAKRVSADCLTVADQVLERRPGYRLALHAEQIIAGVLVSVANDELDVQAAQRWAVRQEQVSLTLLKLDPNNRTSLNNMAVAENQVSTPLWASGRLREALAYQLKSLEYGRAATGGGALFVIGFSASAAQAAWTQAVLGDQKGAMATLASATQVAKTLRESEPGFSATTAIAEGSLKVGEASIALQRDDLPAVRHIAADTVRQLEAIRERGQFVFWKAWELYRLHSLQGRAEYLSGDFADAERSESQSAEARKAAGIDSTDDRRSLHEVETWRAMAQVQQGHLSEAAQTIAPVVKFQRDLAAHNRGDRWQPQELAAALYVQALTEQSKRASPLHEAAALIDGLPPEIRAVHDVQRWRGRILDAQRTTGTANRK